MTDFQAADIVFTRGSAWYSRLIRWGTCNTGEAPSRTNHTGVGVGPVSFIQALTQVVETLWTAFIKDNSPDTYEVWRLISLTDEQRAAIADKALDYLGRQYGYTKIILQGVDCILGKILCRDIMLARRLASMDKYPICSWVVAYSYDRGAGYQFGVPPNVADPDEIYDFVAKTEGWRRVA